MGSGRNTGFYDTAQICLNGHVINDCAETEPQHNFSYCNRCGAPTTTTCEHCQAKIQGIYHGFGLTAGLGHAPAFCHGCGKPYHWTASQLAAARLVADEAESLSQDEKQQLKQSFDDLIRDTPRTQLAATRFKRLAVKAGKGTAEALKEILIQVASETAKKLIEGH